jgi:hypothetical protein
MQDMEPKRIQAPSFWGNFQELLRFRDGLLAELKAGRITLQNYRRRVKKSCAQYYEEVKMRG